MPRYEVILVLTLDADSQHEAAEMADDFAAEAEDGFAAQLPPGDTSLRVKTISWPVD